MDNTAGTPVPSTVPSETVVNQEQNTAMQNNNQSLLRSFSNNQQGATKKPLMPFIAIALAVVFAGIATGWAIAKVENPSGADSNKVSVKEGDLAADEAGLDDESMFEENTPEGVLVEGGLDGEGTHHLDRGAGDDKKVYLTSSVINLDNFVGKKVRVWGNTMAAQQAPWLMDVGKIKVIE